MNMPVAVPLERPADYKEWRAACRRLLAHGIAPDQVAFNAANRSADLFGRLPTTSPESVRTQTSAPHPGFHSVRVPQDFPELAKTVLCHRDDARFNLLYRLLWRLMDEPRLLDNGADKDVWTARKMAKSVRRDVHKMKAFVRFRKIDDDSGEAFVAWFEPDHHIVERTAPFFKRRFAGMHWSIVTPDVSAHWDGTTLMFNAGASRQTVPSEDALEHHWRVYYKSIFNPARMKINAMRAEMPLKYWKNLPESRLIPELTRSAQQAQRSAPSGIAPSLDSARQLVANQPDMVADRAVELTRSPATLGQVALGLQRCTRCNLCHHATAAVAGEGPANAALMIVGEQPGDQEDLTGRPFVGPAGGVIEDALSAAGIQRGDVYLTNAVKHFKYTVRGKRRIHKRPDPGEIERCRWWLDLERDLIQPNVVLALGVTAARAVLRTRVNIDDVRGQPIATDSGALVLVTSHPAWLLRLRDRAERNRHRGRFIEDLRLASALSTTA